MLTASSIGVTSHGASTHDIDNFVDILKVVKFVEHVDSVVATKEVAGSDEKASHAILCVGNCDTLKVDGDTGFIGMYRVLRYTELMVGSDQPALKAATNLWLKLPASKLIAAKLLSRDRGDCQFSVTENKNLNRFFHPAQFLAKVDVGSGTRTWLVSAAAFATSYHQISKAVENFPRDFARLDEHVNMLESRMRVLHSKRGIRILADSAIAAVKSPYPEIDWHPVAYDMLSFLGLLARCDYAVMRHMRRISRTSSAGVAPRTAGDSEDDDKKSKTRRGTTAAPVDVVTVDLTIEQLKFLASEATANGDLWADGSAHAYSLGDNQCGALVVLPSGYAYSVTGSPGTTPQDLLRDRAPVMSFESLIPYLPFELSGYTGDLARLARLEATARGRKDGSAPAKIDSDTARLRVVEHAINLVSAMITAPEMIDLLKRANEKAAEKDDRKKDRKTGAAAASPVVVPVVSSTSAPPPLVAVVVEPLKDKKDSALTPVVIEKSSKLSKPSKASAAPPPPTASETEAVDEEDEDVVEEDEDVVEEEEAVEDGEPEEMDD